MTLILFVPLLLLMFLANLGERRRVWRFFSYLTNLLASVVWVTAGTLLVAGVMPMPQRRTLQTLKSPPHVQAMGWVMLVVGVLSLIAMVPWVRRKLRWPSHGFDPLSSPTHATTLLISLWLMGVAVGQWAAFWGMKDIFKEMPHLSLLDVTLQGVGEVLLALIGVGWLIRRGSGEVVRRLGFGEIKAWHWLLIAAAISGMYSLNLIYGIGSYLFNPGGMKEVEEINKALLGGMFSPWGAVVIGLSAGIGEEMVFRGALQPRLGIVITSFLFMLSHTQYAFSLGVVLIFLLGVILGLLRRYVNLTVAILTHAGYDAIMVFLVMLAQKLAGG